MDTHPCENPVSLSKERDPVLADKNKNQIRQYF